MGASIGVADLSASGIGCPETGQSPSLASVAPTEVELRRPSRTPIDGFASQQE